MTSKGRQRRKKHKPRQKAGKTKTRKRLLVYLLAIATLVGGVAGAVTFLPRVSVSVADPVDPYNPLSSAFTVTNNGYVPLKAINLTFGFRLLEGVDAPVTPRPEPSKEIYTRFRRPEWTPFDLTIDQTHTVTPGDIFRMNIRDGCIALIVSYTLPLFPFRMEKFFPFRAHGQSNGRFYWFSQADC